MRLAVFLLAALTCSSSCVLLTLEMPCSDDDACPFGRVCSAEGTCVEEGSADRSSPGAGGGEGEGEGEPEDCASVTVAASGEGIFLPGDESRLRPSDDVCVTVDGNVSVGDVDTFQAFARVVRVTGRVTIEDTELVDFTGGERWRRLDGDLVVRDNEDLASFAGLENLRVEGQIVVEENGSGLSSAEIQAFRSAAGD